MKLGTLVLAGMCGMVGLVAGRVSAPAGTSVVAAAPLPRIVPTIIAPVPQPVVIDDDEQPPADPDPDGLELANVLASAKQRAAELVHTHRAIRGHITDPSGQGLPGVTVIASGQNGAMTAITNERGDYEIVDLPSANYLVTFYYADQTIERTGIATRDVEPTDLDLSIDPSVHPTYEPEPPTRDDYIVNIPVPDRVFEATLGAAAGSQNDGISFSGGTSLANTYVVIDE